ncbi:MAG: Si-specific NAD(P)(+) transhydrogenase [Fimbriimonadaceae bacterium]|nr:Si-specific NAD(P)(+) transhydrogenase [Fimbriimonadaceae bacterium]
MPTRFDLVVVGSGPAGEKGAAQAAYFGKRVALVERAPHLGGAGINTGTVPSKTLRETALYFSGLRQRGLYGIDYSLKDGLTVADFMHRKQVVIENEWQLIARNLERHDIHLFGGQASLLDAHHVAVDRPGGGREVLEAAVILLAPGSSPHRPAEVPFDDELVYDSDSILDLRHIPRAMTVVGGGVIGCEYASVFTALGAEVTLIEGRDRLLPFVDAEIANRLRLELSLLGLEFRFNTQVTALARRGEQVALTLQDGQELTADTVLYAAGRQSNVDGLGLAAVGVRTGRRGVIEVNAHYQTSVPNIYAAGDVIGFPALASVSMEQARVAMVHAFGLQYKEAVSAVLPLAVYTVPEIAMVGLTEEAAREQGVDYVVGRCAYESNARGQIIGDLAGLLKLLVAPEDGRLLGVHLIGELASELVHLGALALQHSSCVHTFIDSVYNYPTLSECYKYAAYDALGAIQRQSAAG